MRAAIPPVGVAACGGSDAVSDDARRGSYNVTLDTGESLTGTFAPAACRALDAALSGTWAPTCE